MRRILVFSLTLFAQTLAGQVIVGPERQLSVPELQPAAFDQRDAATASDGSGWLVAWTSGTDQYRPAFVAATRIDGSGNVLDPSPIIVATGLVSSPAVAFGGNRYLITWTTATTVRARLVDRDGTLSPTVEIASLDAGLTLPSVVKATCDGTRFLIAWRKILDSSFSTNRKSVAVLDLRGNVIATTMLFEGTSSIDFALAAGNSEFVIFDSVPDFSGIPTGNGYPGSVRALRINDSGRKEGPIEVERATTPVFSPRAAFSGRDYLVVWSANAGLPGQARGARMSLDGTVSPIGSFYSGADTVNTLTWTGSEYIVTLSDQQHVEAVRLDANGAAASPVKSIFVAAKSGATSSSDGAWNGRALLVAIDTSADVYEKFLDRSGSLVDPAIVSSRTQLLAPDQKGLPIALSPSHQEFPGIASAGGGDSLAVWLVRSTLYETPVAMAMPLHDGLPAADHLTVLGQADSAPGVGSDGTQYLVSWVRGRDGLVGQRFDRNGVAIDPRPFVITPFVYGGPPAVSFDGENFIIAYKNGGGCVNLHGWLTQFVSRVSRGGTLLDPNTITVGGQSCGTSLSLASGSNGSLLVWDDIHGPSAAFITREGSTPGPMKLLNFIGGITAVWTGSRFIVMNVAGETITLSADGTPQSYGSKTAIAGSSVALSATRLAKGALFVWNAGTFTHHDVFGLRFSADGEALGQPFVITATEFDETNVAIAQDTDGRAQLLYQRTVDFPGVPGLTRIFTRQIEVIPPPLRRRASR